MTGQTGQTMRAVMVPRHGGADVLEVQQVPVPEPVGGQLLVEVAASGVNFIDVYRREGIYPTDPPFVLGSECAGRVVALGPEGAEFAVGDLVASAATASGSHTACTLIDADQAVPVPDSVAPELAAAAMLQGMTAHYLTVSTYPVGPDTVALVHAAAGGAGQLIVQFAKRAGARVIGTVGSEAKEAIARGAGADEVIRYDGLDTDELAAAVRDAAGGGVHVVYDGVGKATFDASLASLRPRGMLVLFGGASGQVPPFDLQRLNSGGSLYVTRPTLVHYTADREELRWRAAEVLGAIGGGDLHISIGGRYGLDDAQQAYRDLESRHTTGKLLVVP
jgi:NADPH:quinone reductase